MDVRLLLLVSLMARLKSVLAGAVYSHINEGLTSVPLDIGSDVLMVALNENAIVSLEDSAFSYLPGLQYLYMNDNAMSTVSDTAFQNTGLVVLSLNDNQLTRIPYIRDLATTLTMLYLRNNHIDHVTAADFATMDVLSSLYVENNPLSTLPDLPSLLPALTAVSITTFGCCNVQWMKVVGKMIIMKLEPCTLPPALVGVNWLNVTLQRMEEGKLTNIKSRCMFTSHGSSFYIGQSKPMTEIDKQLAEILQFGYLNFRVSAPGEEAVSHSVPIKSNSEANKTMTEF